MSTVVNRSEIPRGSVIVAVDGSEDASRAVTWAAREAILEDRPLGVVHVARSDDDQAAQIVAAAVELARETCPEVEVHASQPLGDPAEVLIALSARARLVVMGSRGRGVVSSMLLGSVSAAVAKGATCPVAVCRPTGRPIVEQAVAVGADGSEESLPVIEFAFQQASLHGMPLDVVHSYVDPGTRSWRRSQRRNDKESLRLLLAESVAWMAEKFPDVQLSLRLDCDTVAEALNPEARPYELVVVGRRAARPRSRTGKELEALAVLERSESTVAVVPEASTT